VNTCERVIKLIERSLGTPLLIGGGVVVWWGGRVVAHVMAGTFLLFSHKLLSINKNQFEISTFPFPDIFMFSFKLI